MADRPDITIPEEAWDKVARVASFDDVCEVNGSPTRITELIEKSVAAAAPLILAAELQRIADRIQPDVQDPDADHWEDRYDEAADDIASALRVRAAELRGGEPQP